MQLTITPLQLTLLLMTIFLVIGGGIYASRTVRTAEGYTLGGRSAGPAMLAGSLAGTMVGGGATIGTAQLASSVGLSAWWFTLGSGITFILMGLFYARPLRRTNLETIPQYLSLHYGDAVGKAATVVASLGIFFSIVASLLPGMEMISALFGTPASLSTLLLLLLVFAYIFFGGMKSAGVGGILKMVLIWVTLLLSGASAYTALHTDPRYAAALSAFPWYSLFGRGVDSALSNFLSLLVGVLSTQTYIQCLFSASSPKTAMYGSFAGALITIPVGLPCSLIGMYMHVARPEVPAMRVLPTYLLEHQPAWIGSLALGGIVLSLTPPCLAQLQGVVVCVLGAGDFAFKRNIAPDRVSAAIQQEGGQETAHTAVSVVEGMDAEKIVDEHRDQDQRIDLLRIGHAVEALADRFYGRRRLKRRKRRKQHKAVTFRISCADIVLRILKGAADPAFGIFEQIPVEL